MAKAKKRPAESWTYVLEADRALDAAQQSRFVLSPMTYAERAAIRDDLLRGEGNVSKVFRNAGTIAIEHLVSIENFPAGEPQPWPADRAARERYLELLDDDDVLEIGNEIWTRSALGYRDKDTEPLRDGDVAKNSSTPEPTSSSGGSSTTTPISIPAPPATAIPS